ncbi:tRNA threonylcarbamoyladenosine dehydratase [Gammaproteobacteria bacterium]|nr:tRNA threonylcarbamoyladenosine dehydratase [Gammaproteobacteria bacterium]
MEFLAAEHKRRFGGLNRLYNPNTLDVLHAAHVVVIGIGGVGSWAAEALARSAIGTITLIDLDNIGISNINRQLQALSSSIGLPKVTAMGARILEINPACKLNLIEDFLSVENIEAYLADLDPNTWIIDCIDQLKIKAHLIAWAKLKKINIITTGAAGGKTDPTQLKIDDLSKTHYDPLCSRLKQHLKKHYQFPAHPKPFKIPCVYSTQAMAKPPKIQNHGIDQSLDQNQTSGGLNCAGYGSIVTVTASMGLFAAGYVINAILK